MFWYSLRLSRQCATRGRSAMRATRPSQIPESSCRMTASISSSGDLCPEMAAGSGSKITRLVVDPQVTFNLFRPVTAHAMLIQKRLKRFIGMSIRACNEQTNEQRPPGHLRDLSIHGLSNGVARNETAAGPLRLYTLDAGYGCGAHA